MRRLLTNRILGIAMAVAVIGFTSPVAHADQRDFTLVNNTGATIEFVYVSPSNVTDWGEDVLGRSVLLDGEDVFIYFSRFSPDSCLYDIKVVTDEGDEGVLNQVNLCEVDTVRFS